MLQWHSNYNWQHISNHTNQLYFQHCKKGIDELEISIQSPSEESSESPPWKGATSDPDSGTTEEAFTPLPLRAVGLDVHNFCMKYRILHITHVTPINNMVTHLVLLDSLLRLLLLLLVRFVVLVHYRYYICITLLL